MARNSLLHHAPSLSFRGEAPAYDEQRLAWAHSLSEMDLRALASEYLMGKRDEGSIDAYQEYKRRFPEEAENRENKTKKKKESSKRSKKTRSSRKGN